MSPSSLDGKTKPNLAPGDPDTLTPDTLTPIQLAAARMYAKGGRTLAIAAALKVHRRTLARWQQLAAFGAEIERVHRGLSQPPPRPAPSPDLHTNEREFLERVYASAIRQFMKL
jgi:hypothetical protein